MIDRLLTRYVMGSMGDEAAVLLHSTHFFGTFLSLFIARAEVMRVNANPGSLSEIHLGTMTTVYLVTEVRRGWHVNPKDLFEDHYRFAGRLAKLLRDPDSLA